MALHRGTVGTVLRKRASPTLCKSSDDERGIGGGYRTRVPQRVERARTWIAEAGRVTVLTGAGISTDSGIPDFRGPNGLWTHNPGPRSRRPSSTTWPTRGASAAWQNRLASPAWHGRTERRPSRARRARTARRLRALVTQNVDGLHQQAGNDPAKVIEVHGTMHWTRCWTARPAPDGGRRSNGSAPGEADPHCLRVRRGGS